MLRAKIRAQRPSRRLRWRSLLEGYLLGVSANTDKSEFTMYLNSDAEGMGETVELKFDENGARRIAAELARFLPAPA